MPRNKTQIYSIFGQIESVAAEMLIKRGHATRIERNEVPHSEAVNSAGQPVQFAVVVPSEHIAEFERLIADLRA